MNYRVTFYKLTKEQKDKELVITGKELLGTVTVDGFLNNPNGSIVSKAFRHASSNCQNADRVEVVEVYK